MNWISALLGNLTYPTIFLLMLLESTVVPVPSELVVVSVLCADVENG